MVRNFTSRIPSRAACAALLLLTPPLRTASASLSLNGEGRPQSLTDVICPGRPRRECEVQLDVPRACSGASSDCPIVLYLHGAGGTIEEFPGTTGVHSAGYIGVYPQGEDGWNTNPKDINDCPWDDFGCTEDPDEGDFIASIISHLRSLGAGGNVYAVGFSNGSALAHRLAANAGPSLPIKGIVGMVANMLASPTRSGPGVLNYNQPGNSGNTLPVSVLSVMGTADDLIPYNGGSSEVFQVEGGDAFQFLPSLDAMQIWAQHNSCGGANSPETSEQQWSMDGRSGVATRFVYTNCPNGVLVEHYAVQGGGHGSGDAVIDGVSMTYDIAHNFIDRVEAGGVQEATAGGDTPDTTATPNADPDPSCEDGNGSCEAWAAAGECERNPAYMVTNCARSCNECVVATPPQPTPEPVDDESDTDTENPTEEATPAPTPESTADLTEESTEESTAEPESTPPKEIAIDWRFGIGFGGAPISANVGDTLLFTWGGFHNVYIAPSNSCNNLSSGTDLGASSPVRYTVQAEDEGGIVFACEVPGHCQAGMLLPVNVGQTSSNESAGTTSDPSCEDGNESCEAWADAGECEGNPDYMLTNCASSCDACGGRRS